MATPVTGRPRLPVDPDPKVQRRREQRREYMLRFRERRRPLHQQIINDFLAQPCVDCGNTYPRAAMQPDHVYAPRKYKISSFSQGNGSTKLLREELAKCQPRCANCHCIRHAENGQRWELDVND